MRESNRSALVGFFASHGLGRALRHRTFALYTLFSWFSTVSFWMQRIGVQWLAWELTHSYSWLGMIALGEALAAFLVTPVAGFVADRHDRVRLAVVSQGGLFLLSLTLAALAWSGLLSIYVLLALTTLTGIVDGFWAPVRIAIVPRLVPRADMGPAFSVGATMFNISQFVGPALAGWLIAHFAMGQVFAMAGLGYFAFTLSLLTMGLKAEEPGTGRGPSRGVLRDVREGLAYVLSQPALRLVMATLFVVAFCYRPYREHLAGLADAVLGVGPEGLATLASASGVGGILGGLVSSTVRSARSRHRLILGGFLVNGLALVLFAQSVTLPMAAACATVMAFAITAVSVCAQVDIQEITPDHFRGRVASLWGLQVRGGPSVGAWAVGAMASVMAIQTSLMILAVIALVFWIFLVLRRGDFDADRGRRDDPPSPPSTPDDGAHFTRDIV